jgi:hypothetical protein
MEEWNGAVCCVSSTRGMCTYTVHANMSLAILYSLPHWHSCSFGADTALVLTAVTINITAHLALDAVKFGRLLPTLRRNLLPSSYGWKIPLQ